MEVNENENTTYQKLWDTARAVLRGKCIALNSYIRKEGKSKISTLGFHHNMVEKEEQINLNGIEGRK